MKIATKTLIELIVLLVLAAAIGSYYTWKYAHSTDSVALAFAKTDLSNYSDEQIRNFVSKLNLASLSMQDRYALADRLETWFNKKTLLDRAKFMSDSMALVDKDPNSILAKNSNQIMETMFRKRMKDYAKATPDQRAKIIADTVQKQVAMDNARKVAQLFSGNPSAADAKPDPGAIRQHIGDAVARGIQNGDPDDRAGAAQYFADLHAARVKAGLNTLY